MAKAKAGAAETQDDGAPKGGAPLFPNLGTEWSYIDVARLDPPEETGFLGRLDLHATEETIKGRWGGGKYSVRAKNDKHQVMNNRTLDVAGDPIFISDAARDQWLRGRGRANEIPPRPGATPAAPAPGQNFGVSEIVALFQGMQQLQMAQQAQQLAQQAEDRRARELADQKREDQRREEDRRREDQRRADEQQREERRTREEEQSRARDREFMSTMLTMVTSNKGGEAGQMAAFTGGITLALKLADNLAAGRGGDDDDDEGGGRDEDPIAETVRGVVKGIGDAINRRGEAGAAPAAAPVAAPALPPGTPEPVTFTGPLAVQVAEFVTKARAAGKNPEALLAGGVDVMMKSLAKVAPAPANGTGVGAAVAAAASKPQPAS